MSSNRARQILEALDRRIINQWMLGLHASTVPFKHGDVKPERHGLFRCDPLKAEKIKPVSRDNLTLIVEYLKEIKQSLSKKKEFFNGLSGSPGTAFLIYDRQQVVARIDRQKPMQSALNIQIQYGKQTIATTLIDNQVYNWAQRTDCRIAAVVNYIIHHFIGMLEGGDKKERAFRCHVTFINSKG